MLDFNEWTEIKISQVKPGDIVIVTVATEPAKLVKVLGVGVVSFVGISGFFPTDSQPSFEHSFPVVVDIRTVQQIFRKPL